MKGHLNTEKINDNTDGKHRKTSIHNNTGTIYVYLPVPLEVSHENSLHNPHNYQPSSQNAGQSWSHASRTSDYGERYSHRCLCTNRLVPTTLGQPSTPCNKLMLMPKR